MKLSESIRLGSMLHVQAFGTLYEHDPEGRVIATCALGAAERAGYDEKGFLRQSATCPACLPLGAFGSELHQIIAHLNDAHHWARERIADYVEAIELAEAAEREATELTHT